MGEKPILENYNKCVRGGNVLFILWFDTLNRDDDEFIGRVCLNFCLFCVKSYIICVKLTKCF